jgi:hypothetical protein
MGATRSAGCTRLLLQVPEGVNTTFYDPALYRPARLPVGDIVFGQPKDRSPGAGQAALLSAIWAGNLLLGGHALWILPPAGWERASQQAAWTRALAAGVRL